MSAVLAHQTHSGGVSPTAHEPATDRSDPNRHLRESQDRSYGPRRGWRQGRRSRGRGDASRVTGPPTGPPDEELDFNGTSLVPPRPQEGASTTSGMASHVRQSSRDSEGSDSDLCFICASPVFHYAVAPCNHRTCHVCALRLRALYKTTACAHCRTSSNYVTFTDDGSKLYQDFPTNDFANVDDRLGINFEKAAIYEDTIALLRFNCPDPNCDVVCLGWADLHRHVKLLHSRVLCDLCTQHKKVFTHEHELLTHSQLKIHEKVGDDNPGVTNQTGFQGHPECGFCKQLFYGLDELYNHCRERHERCHICDRRNLGRDHQYYLDYHALEVHFRQDHFLCPDRECLDKKFVVFESDLDFRAHQLEAHPDVLSKDARREARRVDLSEFDYRSPLSQDQRPGRRSDRSGGGGGRGRDPNADPLPQSTAQPIRRDELAFLREREIRSAQSISTRIFGGHLTAPPLEQLPNRTAQTTSVTMRRPRQAEDGFPSLASLSLGGPSTSASAEGSSAGTPRTVDGQDQRRARHAAVMQRAMTLLRHDQSKFVQYRAKVASYQNSSISAAELVDSLSALFDTSTTDFGKAIQELAEIYESESKRSGLLKAWNDRRAAQEDFPSLPRSSGPASGWSTSPYRVDRGGSARLLTLKNSTAQSARAAASRQGNRGPSLGRPKPSPALESGPSVSEPRLMTITPMVDHRLSSPSQSRPSSRAANARPIPGPSTEAFPALPPAPKPSLYTSGYRTPGVRRVNERVPASNAWDSGPSDTDASTGYSEAGSNAASEDGNQKKPKKNKKQVLYHFG